MRFSPAVGGLALVGAFSSVFASPEQHSNGEIAQYWNSPGRLSRLFQWSKSLLSTPEPEQSNIVNHVDFDKYLDYVVVEYRLESQEERNRFASVASTLVADVWLLTDKAGQLCISRTQLAAFDRLLPSSLQGRRNVLIQDLGRAVLTTYPLNPVNLPSRDFADTAEILRYIGEGAMDIGYSWEGRPIRATGAVAAPYGPFPSGLTEPLHGPRTLVICGIHGREWASISACLALLDDLPANTAVIPLANPDGYVYTWTHDRLWSKNRQPTPLVLCTGHNLATALDGPLTDSEMPCSESWAGRDNNMPLEARAIRDFARQFDKVIEVHGLSPTPMPSIENINGRTVIRLPDYGTSILMPRKHLGELERQMTTAIRSQIIASQ